jgi:agmatine deiminase
MLHDFDRMTTRGKTPRELEYQMPAEWEPHAATWLSWPRRDALSFAGRHDEVLPTFGEIVRALAPHEAVHINVCDGEMETEARRTIGPIGNVRFHQFPTNEPWCRDYGPTFVKRAGEVAVVDWIHNAWGGKYPRFADDDAVPQHVARSLGLPLFSPGIVMEGGSLDVNGEGLLLTTEACLLNQNRNPHLTKAQIEEYLKDFLGVERVLWLGRGIAGDDTDGHVDDLTRFVGANTVVTAVEEDPSDDNYEALHDNLKRLRAMKEIRRIVELPMPDAVEYRGKRLPACYANFYIANNVVLLPVFRQKRNDERAQQILQELFPARRVVPIDCSAVIFGRGSIHCLTQQQPRA